MAGETQQIRKEALRLAKYFVEKWERVNGAHYVDCTREEFINEVADKIQQTIDAAKAK